MWLTWKWIGLSLMIIAYLLLVYWQRRRWRSPSTEIGIIVITMMFFDWLMTWFGQTIAYWQRVSEAEIIDEASPVGWFLLGQHPMAYAAGSIFYMIIVVIFIRVLCRYSRFLMIVISSALAVGHGYCALQWLCDNNPYILYGLINSRIDSVPFVYLLFIIIGLVLGILLIRRKNNRS
jgi:hypothetical protein